MKDASHLPGASHHPYMHEALAAARRALAHGDVPVGAVVVRQGRVIATGCNVRERDQDPTGHAELVALRAASSTLGRWRLADCTLYVTLEPCPMCAPALGQARLERVVFGASDPRMGAAGSVLQLLAHPALGPGPEVLGGILEAECQAVLREFFAQRRPGP